MVLNISHADKVKYREALKPKKARQRKNRSRLLSKKSKDAVFKQFAGSEIDSAIRDDVELDEHVKMNDNYMRTGPYLPKKK